jgi:hypothetical protein
MSVKWAMELVDKVSAPAKGVHKSLEHVDEKVEQLDKHSKHAHGTLAELAHGIEHANKKAGKEFLEGLAEKFAVFSVGYELAEKFLETLVEIGAELVHDAVGAANFGRSTRIVFDALLGSSEKGNEAVEYLEQWAIAAGIGVEKSRDLVRSLSLSGFEGKNLNVVMNAAVDVEALSGGRFQAMEFAEAFGALQTRGELSARMLAQFQSILGEGGFDKLAKKLGFATHGFHQLQKQLEETPVSAHRAEQAILDVVEEVSGGKLGATQEKLGRELPGIWQRIEDRLHVMLGKVGESPAWEHLLEIFTKLSDALDPATESGKSFQASLERIVGGVGELFEDISKPGAMEGFIDKLNHFADSAATVATAVISITEAIASLVGWWNEVPDFVKSASNPLAAISKSVSGGFVDAVKWVKGAHDEQAAYQGERFFAEQKKLGEQAGQGLKDGVATSLDIHSPSRVMYRLGANAGEGLRQGVQASTSSGAAGGRQLVVNLEVNVNGSADDGEELGHQVAKVLLGELQPAFDSLLEQLGEAA